MIHPLPLPFIYSRVAILSFIFQSVRNLLVITSYLMILNTIYMLMIPKFIPRFQITPWILVSQSNYGTDVSTWMQKFVLQMWRHKLSFHPFTEQRLPTWLLSLVQLTNTLSFWVFRGNLWKSHLILLESKD